MVNKAKHLNIPKGKRRKTEMTDFGLCGNINMVNSLEVRNRKLLCERVSEEDTL